MRKIYITELLIIIVVISVGLLLAEKTVVKRPRVLGISHVCYDVSDLSKARVFYNGLLGFEEHKVVASAGTSSQVIFIAVNNRQYIELLNIEPPPGRGRLNCIAFYTDNVAQMHSYLASRGVNVPEKLSRDEAGELSFRFDDPDGNTIEMVQFTSNNPPLGKSDKSMSSAEISKHLSSVGFPVRSFQKSQQFYSTILGFSEFWNNSAGGEAPRLVNLRVPDGQDYIAYMLYEGGYPSVEQLAVMERSTLIVQDMRKAVSDLKSRSAFATYGHDITAHVAPNNKWAANLFDPEGIRIQLMEPNVAQHK